jgi:hypothetical protein
VQYDGNMSTAFFDSSLGFGGNYVQGSDTIGLSGPPSNSRGGSATGSAHASYSSSLIVPSMTASVDAASPLTFQPSSARVNFTMDYFFVVTGPGSTAVVDVVARGFGSSVGGAVAREFLGVGAVGFPVSSTFGSPFFDWTANTSFTVFTNAVYDVHMNVQAIINSALDFQSATATVDPQFFIDASNPNADQYGLFFSAGVVNTQDLPTSSATPLPAALPLFAGGLGATGLFVRQRKRK